MESNVDDIDSSFELLDPFPAFEHDMMLTDINQDGYVEIFRKTDIKNLSLGSFSTSPFPVNGCIFGPNLRLMVSLNCRRAGQPHARVVRIWFIADSGSFCTFLSEDSMDALMGQRGSGAAIFGQFFTRVRREKARENSSLRRKNHHS